LHYSLVTGLTGGPSWDITWLTLFVFVALQAVLTRFIKLRPSDTIAIFCFLLIATSASEGVSRFMPVYTVPHYFAGPDNNLQTLADRYIPARSAPTDPEVIRTYYEGSFDRPASIRPWLVPMGLRITFFMVLWVTLYCIVALLRRHWVEHEKLAFPLVTVPLYIAASGAGRIRPRTTIWAEPLMWVGFGVPFLHCLSIMLHALNPSFPTLGRHTEIGAVSFCGAPAQRLR
jgi:hypothetical protein